MGVKEFAAGGRVPTIGEVDQHDIKRVANHIEPTEGPLHCEVEPGLRIALAGQVVQMFGPFDVGVAWGRLKRHMEEPVKARILRNIFGPVSRAMHVAEQQHQFAASLKGALRTHGRDPYPGGEAAERALRIGPEIRKPPERMNVDLCSIRRREGQVRLVQQRKRRKFCQRGRSAHYVVLSK